MAFDVSKFLALTALIAATGSACSSNDKDKTTPNEGGSSGNAGSNASGSKGEPGGQAGAAEAGNGGAAGGSAGEGGGNIQGGAGEGGARAGGAGEGGGESLAGGGAGGSPDVGECLGSLAAGGAGGAPGVEPSLEGLCMDFFDVVCPGIEGDAPSYTVCEGVKARGTSAVAVAVADCIKALSADDACDLAKVHACFTSLEGKGCANPEAATACTTIQALAGCEAIDLAQCEKVADLVNPEMNEGFAGCMDPANEGWYEPAFTGTCAERLDFCAGVRTF
jgi:hypothetical protein